MKLTIQIIALLVFASISILAQETIDRKIVMEKYDEVSRFASLTERREFLSKQTEEMRTALWQEHINRKISEAQLSAEQTEVIDLIRTKIITVEFAKSVRGKTEADWDGEYKDIMNRASLLLGKERMREWFGILGDIKTLKKI